ncbi:UNVERIFIED_CONTAM: hypothetical protein Scaly_1646500 [Sesamum calycinum]|uniref:Integrase catalytic domain-containing protein n=1 Tax=Sesamum calycinum TaxID=2727403 RepID=A0AAW2PBF1_9LAMI
MTNEIHKQYDRLDDVSSIMLRMKVVYAVPDRHIRYAATKAFFGIKMAKGSSATTYKSATVVLVGEASTSKAKGKRARRWKRKKGKGKVVVATASVERVPAAPTGKGKGKEKVGGSQRVKANDVCMYFQGKGHWKRECLQLLSNLVLERSKRLNKDEIILRLGDGKTITVEAVGSLSLVVSDHIRIELKDYIYGPLNTLARGGYSYFITFTDDHSRYGYVYLMRYKSKAFGKSKEYRLEVENQTARKIKALRSDRGEEYLSGEFINYLTENGIPSQ